MQLKVWHSMCSGACLSSPHWGRQLRLEDCELEANLGYIARPCLKTPKINKNKKEINTSSSMLGLNTAMYCINVFWSENVTVVL